MSDTPITLQDLSEDQLAELRDQLRKADALKSKQAQSRQEAYERHRNQLVDNLVTSAKEWQALLADFKVKVSERLDRFYHTMQEYGDIPLTNKGNFTLYNEDRTRKVEVSRSDRYEFDERAEAAAELIRDFLRDTVKKRDKDAFDLIMDLIERDGKTGKFDSRKIHTLYKYEDRFKDDRFGRAIGLFKEAYIKVGTATYFRFFELQESGWKSISLQFSAL